MDLVCTNSRWNFCERGSLGCVWVPSCCCCSQLSTTWAQKNTSKPYMVMYSSRKVLISWLQYENEHSRYRYNAVPVSFWSENDDIFSEVQLTPTTPRTHSTSLESTRKGGGLCLKQERASASRQKNQMSSFVSFSSKHLKRMNDWL